MTTVTKIAISIKNINKPPPPFWLLELNSKISDCGKRPKIPTMIMIDVPFPKPLSCIFSPNHITNNVPAVKVITVDNQKNGLKAGISASAYPGLFK